MGTDKVIGIAPPNRTDIKDPSCITSWEFTDACIFIWFSFSSPQFFSFKNMTEFSTSLPQFFFLISFAFKKLYHFCSKTRRGLPWWRSGWESACQCRGHGFEPWSGKMPHAAEQLGPWATLLSLRVWSLCSATRGQDSERPAHRDEEWPPLATTRESPHTEMKTQHNHK